MNSLVSAKSALPIDYYSLPFCRPAKIVSSAENLGEVLRGDRIYNSLYQARPVARQRSVRLGVGYSRTALPLGWRGRALTRQRRRASRRQPAEARRMPTRPG